MIDSEAIKTLLEIGAINRSGIQAPDGSVGVIVPREFQLQRLEPVEPPLPRINQRPVFHDEASFIAYVNRFKTDATQIFSEPGFIADKPHVTAVFDYHKTDGPDRLAHVATYRPRYSDQWQLWTRLDPMLQADFAEFIEENRKDIVAPNAADLLDMARNFKASKKVEYDAVVYQPNGDIKLGYEESTEAKGTIGVPDTMELGIPVYFRGTAYKVDVFVRYRVGSGKVTFALKVDRGDIIENDAFTELVGRIGQEVGITPYAGRAA